MLEKVAKATLKEVKAKLTALGYKNIADNPKKLSQFVILLQRRSSFEVSQDLLDEALEHGLVGRGARTLRRGIRGRLLRKSLGFALDFSSIGLSRSQLSPILAKLTRADLTTRRIRALAEQLK